MIKFKKYSIEIGKYTTNYYRIKNNFLNKYNPNERIERLLKIDYFYNYKKKLEDIKEFICDFFNYTYCHCQLKICLNKVLEYKTLFKNDLEYCKDDDSTLLSDTDLEDSFYIIIFADNKCSCPLYLRQKMKISKTQLLKLLNKEDENTNNFEKEIKQKDNKIKKLESTMNL